MHDDAEFRPPSPQDLPHLKSVLDASGLFPSGLLDGLIQPFLQDPRCNHVWLIATLSGIPVALAYCEPERMTDRTWNLLAIAVHPDCQNRGIGTGMLHHLQTQLTASGQRLLIVETSSLPEYERTRRFYAARGYTEMARIRDFYADGEDKQIFWRRLQCRGAPPAGRGSAPAPRWGRKAPDPVT